MVIQTYSQVRSRLASLIEEAAKNHEVGNIQRRSEGFIVDLVDPQECSPVLIA